MYDNGWENYSIQAFLFSIETDRFLEGFFKDVVLTSHLVVGKHGHPPDVLVDIFSEPPLYRRPEVALPANRAIRVEQHRGETLCARKAVYTHSGQAIQGLGTIFVAKGC